MSSISLRRLLFDRLFINLALVLGLTQVLLWHWVGAVLIGDAAPGPLEALGVAGVLVAGNGLAVPALRRSRRRADWVGGIARGYMNLGVSTLLLGITVTASWLVFGLFAGLLGVFGAGPELAFGVFRATSGAAVGSVALLLLWGFTFGQSQVSYTRLRVAIPGLSEELVGLRIVQISDLHIMGSVVRRRTFPRGAVAREEIRRRLQAIQGARSTFLWVTWLITVRCTFCGTSALGRKRTSGTPLSRLDLMSANDPKRLSLSS